MINITSNLDGTKPSPLTTKPKLGIIPRIRPIDKKHIFVIRYHKKNFIISETVYIRATNKGEAKRIFIQKICDDSLSIRSVCNVEDLVIN